MTDKYKAVIVQPDGTIQVKKLNRTNDVEEMRDLVGSRDLQMVGYGDVRYWMDEEVKFKPHFPNHLATVHCQRELEKFGHTLMPGDYLGGTIVITGSVSGADGDKILDVPERVIDELVNP